MVGKSPNFHPLKQNDWPWSSRYFFSSQKSGIIAPMNIEMKIPQKMIEITSFGSNFRDVWHMNLTNPEGPGIRDPKAKQYFHGWRFGDFQPFFLVMIWFIIQLKHPFYKRIFLVPGGNDCFPVRNDDVMLAAKQLLLLRSRKLFATNPT